MKGGNVDRKLVAIVVLNDGETFTDIDGCSICLITPEDYHDLTAKGYTPKDILPVVEVALSREL